MAGCAAHAVRTGGGFGTFDYFSEAVSGKAKASRGDYTASEDDNVLVQGVEHNRNALGYFGFAYYSSHKERMRAIPILNDAGNAVSPTLETVVDGTYQPLARPLFIYVNAASAQPARSAQLHRLLPDDRREARD